jgi:anti-anti-sigma factor
MGTEDQLRIDAKPEGDRIVLRLCGELDLATVPALQSELQGLDLERTTMVLLDLRELQFMDSTGLRAILNAHERAWQRGQEFAVTRGSDQVERLLSITRLRDHLPILDSPEDWLLSDRPA